MFVKLVQLLFFDILPLPHLKVWREIPKTHDLGFCFIAGAFRVALFWSYPSSADRHGKPCRQNILRRIYISVMLRPIFRRSVNPEYRRYQEGPCSSA